MSYATTTPEMPLSDTDTFPLASPTATDPTPAIPMDSTVALIAQELEYAFLTRECLEIRLIGPNIKPRWGRFTAEDIPQLAQDIFDLNSNAIFIFYTLNTLNPALPRTGGFIRGEGATGDKDIARRIVLFIDVDPVLPSHLPTKTASTDEEQAHARRLVERIHADLQDLFDFPEGEVVMSGNGCQLLLTLDLPNTAEITALIQQSLRALDQQYSNDFAKVDISVSNAGRICKLPGTMARKGTHSGERPHRVAKRVGEYQEHLPVSLDALKALATTFTTAQGTTSEGRGDFTPADYANAPDEQEGWSFAEAEEWLLAWLKRYSVQVAYTRDKAQGRFFFLPDCVLTHALGTDIVHEHTEDAAIFIRRDEGHKICYHCFHATCQRVVSDGGASNWRTVRGYIEEEFWKWLADEHAKMKESGSSGGTPKNFPPMTDTDIIDIEHEIAERSQGLNLEDDSVVSALRMGIFYSYKEFDPVLVEAILDKRAPLKRLAADLEQAGKKTFDERIKDLKVSFTHARKTVYADAESVLNTLHAAGNDIYDADFLSQYIDTVFDTHTRDFIEKVLKDSLELTPQAIQDAANDFLNTKGQWSGSYDVLEKEDDEAFEWAVKGILPRKGTSLLSAPPKAGKTMLVRWLAYCLATGRDFLNTPVRQSRVLLYGAEENKIELRASLRQMVRSYGDIPPPNLYLKIGIPNKRRFLHDLKKYILDGFDFIIIDPLIDTLTVENTNEYAAVNEAVKPMCRLAAEHNVHILCAHHSKRSGSGSDGFMGSQAFRAFTSCNLRIDVKGGDESDGDRFLTSEKRHSELVGGSCFTNVHLLWNKQDNSLSVGNATPEDKEKHKKDKKNVLLVEMIEKMIRLLQKNPETLYGKTDLREILDGDNNLIDKARAVGITYGIFWDEKVGKKEPLHLTTAFLAVENLPETVVDAISQEE